MATPSSQSGTGPLVRPSGLLLLLGRVLPPVSTSGRSQLGLTVRLAFRCFVQRCLVDVVKV
ncbi:hypothetical protein RHMOL_Rhmol10G0193500 [Rhododendron molle]|uniref:Uncharacterized protein n=1 Tax=Rhododendron molle TaxID=49168 RepID=A0ACC0M3Z8_RHOML|nr:hypothetical protein RHMOL_Rhmol10G0193500 [Rhododendron molle]